MYFDRDKRDMRDGRDYPVTMRAGPGPRSNSPYAHVEGLRRVSAPPAISDRDLRDSREPPRPDMRERDRGGSRERERGPPLPLKNYWSHSFAPPPLHPDDGRRPYVREEPGGGGYYPYRGRYPSLAAADDGPGPRGGAFFRGYAPRGVFMEREVGMWGASGRGAPLERPPFGRPALGFGMRGFLPRRGEEEDLRDRERTLRGPVLGARDRLAVARPAAKPLGEKEDAMEGEAEPDAPKPTPVRRQRIITDPKVKQMIQIRETLMDYDLMMALCSIGIRLPETKEKGGAQTPIVRSSSSGRDGNGNSNNNISSNISNNSSSSSSGGKDTNGHTFSADKSKHGSAGMSTPGMHPGVGNMMGNNMMPVHAMRGGSARPPFDPYHPPPRHLDPRHGDPRQGGPRQADPRQGDFPPMYPRGFPGPGYPGPSGRPPPGGINVNNRGLPPPPYGGGGGGHFHNRSSFGGRGPLR